MTQLLSSSTLGQNNNPSIFFNTNNYYSLIQQFYHQILSNHFLTQQNRHKILFSNSFQQIQQFIKNYKPPKTTTY
ncbi:LOG family protein [Staphylococcus capitis]|uniref:LOG family protein n=1 Tax=Staphylococcus capitis TaxID=29388 RepID=UPI0021B1EB2F